MSIPNRLKEARIAAGLSQGQTAKKLSMHRPTISEIEAGRRKVTAEEIEMFASLYSVSANWLINGSIENDASDAKIQIAARELSKMSDEDIESLMKTLKMLRNRN